MTHLQTYVSPIWVEWFDYCNEHEINPYDEDILKENGISII